MKTELTIGTRQSLLALWQSQYIAGLLQNHYPSLTIKLKKIITKGDRILDVPLAKIGGKGLFTKEIENELLDGTIDLAVHSLKDMPTKLPAGLCLTAITERAVEGDAFVSNKYEKFTDLPSAAVLGTSSLRRRAQLLAARPDLKIVDLRGNVDTRLRKLDAGEMDAVILAAAGLMRLGYAGRIKELLPAALCLPAVGQGALALECRVDDAATRELLAFLDDEKTHLATQAERAFLAVVEGGCQVPIGVHATVSDDEISIEAIIASLDGARVLRRRSKGKAASGATLAVQLAKKMLAEGGSEILREIGLS